MFGDGWSTGKSGTPNTGGQLPLNLQGFLFEGKKKKAILPLMGHFLPCPGASSERKISQNSILASKHTQGGKPTPVVSPPLTTATAACLSHPESLARLNICSSFLVVSRSILSEFNTCGRCLNGKMRGGTHTPMPLMGEAPGARAEADPQERHRGVCCDLPFEVQLEPMPRRLFLGEAQPAFNFSTAPVFRLLVFNHPVFHRT